MPPPAAPTGPSVIRMSFPRLLKRKKCPLGCPGAGPTSRSTMRRHFSHRHPETLCYIEEDMFPPFRCDLCGMIVTHNALRRGHRHSAVCRAGQARRAQAAAINKAREALTRKFYAYGNELE